MKGPLFIALALLTGSAVAQSDTPVQFWDLTPQNLAVFEAAALDCEVLLDAQNYDAAKQPCTELSGMVARLPGQQVLSGVVSGSLFLPGAFCGIQPPHNPQGGTREGCTSLAHGSRAFNKLSEALSNGDMFPLGQE